VSTRSVPIETWPAWKGDPWRSASNTAWSETTRTGPSVWRPSSWRTTPAPSPSWPWSPPGAGCSKWWSTATSSSPRRPRNVIPCTPRSSRPSRGA